MLDRTLAEMRKVGIPDGVDWELLVVNNNCTDNTDEVIARHGRDLPLRRLFEPNPGQTNARNCAISAASGDLIVWTDDDVLVDPEWITAYCQAACEYPDASFFGGQILPWFEGKPPKWLEQNWRIVEGVFAIRDLGEEPLQFSERLVPFGANFAVRTEVQRRYPFDPKLGLRPGGTLRGDETTLLMQMLADGLCGWWVPDAKVRHFIPKKRQTTRYLRDFARGQGEYLNLTGERVGGVHWFGKPRWLWRSLVMAGIRYHGRRWFAQPRTWLPDLMTYGKWQGKFGAYHREGSTQ